MTFGKILLRLSGLLNAKDKVAKVLPKLVKIDNFGVYKIVESSKDAHLSYPRTAATALGILNWLGDLKSSTLQRLITMSCAAPSLDKSPFVPPQEVRGMKILDPGAFALNVSITGIKVPSANVAHVRKRFKDLLIKIPRLKPIAELSDDDALKETHKLFLFKPTLIQSVESFSKEDRKFLSNSDVLLDTCQQYAVTLTYENWTYDEILDAILPEGCEGVGGFSIIGHIAHLNLKEHLLEYKNIIGQVILDKLSAVKTVVHKTHTIDNTFRNFQMEVLAGEPNFVTVAREHGLAYKMDFSKVYWNSRLGTEHQRIVGLLNAGDVLYDVFAGVGPFAVPAAKKGCIVLANDLNPESYSWLLQNIPLNKVQGKVQAFNMDGRDFITNVLKPDLIERWKNSSSSDDRPSSPHVVMNLPALAIEFLDSFRGLFPHDVEPRCTSLLPTVYCYCFSKCEDPAADAAQRTAVALGLESFELLEESNVRIVRNVAPGKEMLCVSFRLPWSVLGASMVDAVATEIVSESKQTGDAGDVDGPVEKKAKIN